ncbi:MAG: hypothetical protein ABWX83_03170 [Luteibacter sp.]
MAEGFQTRTSGGGIQIDQTYRNLALRAKGSFVPGTAWNNGKWRLGTITVNGNSPVLAWRCASPAAMVQASRSGNSITYTFIIAANGGAIDWYLFDEPAYGSATGDLGIRIRNPSTGVVVFDSRMKYMRIVGTVSGDFTSLAPPAGGSYSGAPAIVTGNSPYSYLVQTIGAPGGPPPYPWIDLVNYVMASVSGGNVAWTRQATDGVQHPANQNANSPSSQFNYNYLVIDVAGF